MKIDFKNQIDIIKNARFRGRFSVCTQTAAIRRLAIAPITIRPANIMA